MSHLSFVSSINCRFYLLSFYVLSYTALGSQDYTTSSSFTAPEMLCFLWDLDTGLMKSKKSSDLGFFLGGEFKISSSCTDTV